MNITPPLRSSPPRYQGGFSLIVSLLMLVVIIILGIGASNIALNEERASRNDRDYQIAFQAAEAALKDAEMELTNPSTGVACGDNNQFRGRNATSTCFDGKSGSGFLPAAVTCTGAGTSCCSVAPNPGLCDSVPVATPPTWQSVDFTVTGSGAQTVVYGTYTSRTYRTGAGQSVIPPRYIIERVQKNTSLANNLSASEDNNQYMYRITAMGFGATTSFNSLTPNARVVLQSVVNVLQ